MSNGDKKKGGPKTRYVKTKGGSTIKVSNKTVKAAKAKTGVFKQREWGGKKLKNDSGKQYGVKMGDGKVKKYSEHSTGVSPKKVIDKKYKVAHRNFKADSTAHAQRTDRFANATLKRPKSKK